MRAIRFAGMELIWNILVSLVSGSVGSVFFAQAAGRRSEIARTRYIAASTLRGTLRVYQQELDYQYKRRPGGGYPPEFAAWTGQERLAEEILRALPDLSRRTARRVRAELPPLFGSITLDFVGGRMYVPETSRDPQGEQARHELALRQVTAEPDRYSDGLLPRLLSDQNRPAEHAQAYDGAQAALCRMVDAVKP